MAMTLKALNLIFSPLQVNFIYRKLSFMDKTNHKKLIYATKKVVIKIRRKSRKGKRLNRDIFNDNNFPLVFSQCSKFFPSSLCFTIFIYVNL